MFAYQSEFKLVNVVVGYSLYQVRSSTLGKSVSFELSSSDKRRTWLGLGLGVRVRG